MDNLKKCIYELVAAQKISAREATSILTQLQKAEEPVMEDIAIIGLAGRFPKADHVDAFWSNIRVGRDCIDHFPEQRLRQAEPLLSQRGHLHQSFKKGGYLEDISLFDPERFRISPKEAMAMEPYQRIMLELAYETLNNGGYDTQELSGSKTGVFIGKDHVTGIEYRHFAEHDIFSLTGSWPGILASRISYVYNLKGPSVVLDTSCSSGLSAVHSACESLRRKECDMAFVGGISGLFYVPPIREDGTLDQVESQEDLIRAFDRDAAGTVWGEGGGGLLLKPFSRAVRDGDVLYAVIKGSGMNNNGLSKGITAPNGESQEELLKSVWKKAQIDPETIKYIEAHGTGTILGDTIELNSIINALQAFTSKKQFCGVGSVKTNIGHLVGASGIASLIKAVFMLQNGELPPSLHFQHPSPFTDLVDSPVFINDKGAVVEKSTQHPMRIGINSFGFSGTNCHVLLEEVPAASRQEHQSEGPNLLVLSVKDGEQLQNHVQTYRRYLLQHREIDLSDFCYTTSVFRNHHTHRVAVIFNGYTDLLYKLSLITKINLSDSVIHSDIYYARHRVVPEHKSVMEHGEMTELDKRALSGQANETIQHLILHKADLPLLWQQVAQLYIKGADVDWRQLYSGRSKIALPADALDRIPYWPTLKPSLSKQVEKENGSLYYEQQWKEEKAKPSSGTSEHETVLCVADGPNAVRFARKTLNGLNSKASFLVEIGQMDTGQHQLSGSEEDFLRFFASLRMDSIDRILYFAPRGEEKPLTLDSMQQLTRDTVRPLCNFIKALHTVGSLRRETDLAMITEHGQTITAMDTVCNPYQRMLIGIGRSVRHESMLVRTRNIDICREEPEWEQLLQEISTPAADYSVALRSGKRYVEIIGTINESSSDREAIEICPDDVFLIIGGLGRLGMEVCRFLSRQHKIRLVVVGQSPLADRELWTTIISGNKDQAMIRKINCITAVEETGSSLEYYATDIRDENSFRHIIQQIRDSHPALKGVIHCADMGVGGIEGLNMDQENFEQRYSVKVYGSWLLSQLTEAWRPDFYMFFSSVVTATGGKGALGYIAGNAFMDGLAMSLSLQGQQVISVNWAAWLETAKEHSLQEDRQFFQFLSNDQGQEALSRLLRKPQAGIIVGRPNPANKLLKEDALLPFRLAENVKSDLFPRAEVQMQKVTSDPVIIIDKAGYTAAEKELAQLWAEVLGRSSISIFDSFHQLGGDSIHAALLYKQLDRLYPGVIEISDIFMYPTIREMAAYLDGQKPVGTSQLSIEAVLDRYKQSDLSKDEAKRLLGELNVSSQKEKGSTGTSSKDEYAIVGYACKFPLADNADQYWSNLKTGVNAVRSFPSSRRKDTDAYIRGNSIAGVASYSQGGYLDNIDQFDAPFFRLSPKEADMMDPEHRLLLQTAYEAIEHSGLGGTWLSGSRTGVYVGKDTTGRNEYNEAIGMEHPLKITSGSTGILASRISYFLNLTGPCLVVDTACSSSLSALYMAMQAMEQGQIDTAIVAGISLAYVPMQSSSLIDSQDGVIRPFDAEANGTMWGEGVGTIVLKRLEQAVVEHDVIHAVVKGGAMNNNGTSNGITAPSAEAQEQLLVEAWESAGIEPETLSYIETHGTGTKLGDPIEIKGMSRAFGRFTNKTQFCAIGTVKSGIGHLVGASGMAGIIKMILAFKHKQLPPSLHFSSPNPYIAFAGSPVYINDRLMDWNMVDGVPRRSGISSFGFSGTNVHMVLEEPPVTSPFVMDSPSPYLLTLSAKTQKALTGLIRRYAEVLNHTESVNSKNMCYTSNTRRGHYEHRVAMVVNSGEELREKIGLLFKLGVERGSTGQADMFYEHVRVVHNQDDRSNNELLEEEQLRLTARVDHLLLDCGHGSDEYSERIREVARLYVAGADVNWNLLYQEGGYKAAELPVYVYDSLRHWLPEMSGTDEAFSVPQYQLRWYKQEQSPDTQALYEPIPPQDGVWLVFAGRTHQSRALVEMLRTKKIRMIEVEYGSSFRQVGEDCYTMSGLHDIGPLLEELKDISIRNLLHMGGMSDQPIHEVSHLRETQDRGVYHLFQMVVGMLRQNYTQPVSMFIVADCAYAVNGEETVLHPHNASIYGLAKVIPQEYPQFACRCMDVDSLTLPETIWNELCSPANDFLVAYRRNERYIEVLEEASTSSTDHKVEIHTNGTYLITGGFGGIGLHLAEHLSKRQPVRLCLLGRSLLPPRAQWDEIEQGTDNLSMTVKAIKAIESNGSAVEIYSADITDEIQLKEALEKIRSRNGRIQGIFHCAGQAGEGLLVNKEEQRLREVIDVKTAGTWLLDHYTAQDRPDFFLMFSSVTTLLGAVGQGDYTAANAYLNAYSDYRSLRVPGGITVAWPAWLHTGMTNAYEVREGASPFRGITPIQGLKLMDSTLRSMRKHVIAGEIEPNFFAAGPMFLPFLISDQLQRKIEPAQSDRTVKEAKAASLPTPLLKGRMNHIYSPVETSLAALWQVVLGVSEVDVHQSFQETGGNSILAVSLVNEINRVYPELVNINTLYSYPSIAKMATYVERKQTEAGRGQEQTAAAGNPATPSSSDNGLKDKIAAFAKGSLSAEHILAYLENKDWVEEDD